MGGHLAAGEFIAGDIIGDRAADPRKGWVCGVHFNHSCVPNCWTSWDAALKVHRVVAMCDISPGTELTLSYIDSLKPRQSRQRELDSIGAGFQCAESDLAS